MKHLKPFNENIAQKYLDANNVLKDVFAELHDDTSIQIEYYAHLGDMCVTIKPWTKTEMMTPEDMVAKYERLLELVKDIAVCYKRATEELACKSQLVVSADNKIYCRFTIDKEEYTF